MVFSVVIRRFKFHFSCRLYCFFNLGSIISNFLAPKLIRLTGKLIVGPYFSITGSALLFLCTLTMNVYIIFIGITLFGFLTPNIMPIIFRQSVRSLLNQFEQLPPKFGTVWFCLRAVYQLLS